MSNMDMDWTVDVDMHTDIESDMEDDDDDDEIRQLDAALEEAEIEVRETNSAGESGWKAYTNSTLQTTVPSETELTLREVAKIDSTLALNKQYDEKTRRLERILGLRLRECRLKLNDIQTSGAMADRLEVFRYINCGRPYFRDENNFPAPDNEDAIMAKNQMYDFSLVTSVPGWTVRDKNQFTEVMIQISLDRKREDYRQKILELQEAGNDRIADRKIAKLQKERDNLSAKMPFAQLALPLDQEYDWDMLANKLNRRHTAHEYRCLWKLYFHPSINKNTWKNCEHNKLQTLASDQQYQDWDEIARKLNTGRTGYQCFVYFRTNMTNTCIGKKWTEEEVTYLKRLIDYFREDFYIPWGKIAAAMEQRTKIQIYNKYLRLIEQRKGRFLPEEDAVILNCVERFGTNFRRMTEYLPHRSMVQIRARYQVLSKMRISTVWSPQDDKKLIQIMSNQYPNMTFSNATKFFPGRNRINIRSRYMTLIKWMKKHPNLDIEHAPRRGARRLNHGQASDDLNKAIENLKNTLNTEVEIKKERNKITKKSDEHDLNVALAAVIVTLSAKKGEKKKSSEDNFLPDETAVQDVEVGESNLSKILIFLGSALYKESFKRSHFSIEYPHLLKNDKHVSIVKVKSYSRKETVKTIRFPNTPDIWGKKALDRANYVLPPNYSTITACKALMSHVNEYSMYCNAVSLHVLARRNPVLKEHMDQLLERYYTLLLWPILLSNEGPSYFHTTKLWKTYSHPDKKPLYLLDTHSKSITGEEALTNDDSDDNVSSLLK